MNSRQVDFETIKLKKVEMSLNKIAKV